MKLDEEESPCPDPVDTTETETGSNFRTGGSDQEGDRLKRRKRHPGNLSHLRFTTARRGDSVASEHGGKGGIHGHAEALEQKTCRNATASEAGNDASATIDRSRL